MASRAGIEENGPIRQPQSDGQTPLWTVRLHIPVQRTDLLRPAIKKDRPASSKLSFVQEINIKRKKETSSLLNVLILNFIHIIGC